MATVDGVNAHNIDYKQPGAGLAWGQQTPDSLLSQLPTIYAQRGQDQGGMKALWENLGKYASSHNTIGEADHGGFNQYLQTGQVGANFDKDYAARAYDYAMRAAGQHQQHKADGSFLESILTDWLPEVALSFVNPYLAAGYGALKGGIEDGWSGAALGGLQGYGAGQLGAGLGSEFSSAGGWSELLNNPAEFAKTLGYNVAGDVSSAAGNLWNTVSNIPGEVAGFFGGGAPGAAGAGGALASGVPAGGAAGTVAYPDGAMAGIPFANGTGVGAGAADAGAATGAASGLTDTALQTLSGVGTAVTNAATGAAPIIEQGTKYAGQATAPGFLDKAMGAIGKLGSPAQLGMLGLTGAQALMGPQTSTAEKTLANQAKPYNQEAQQLMQFYNSGQLHPADEHALTQFEQQEQAKINEYWARSGAPNSTGRLQMLQDLQTKVSAMRDQTRQSYLASALRAGGLGTQATQTLAQLQQLGDNQASQALTNMMQQLAFSNAYAQRAKP